MSNNLIFYIALIFIVFVSGCTTVRSNDREYSRISFFDGVDAKEAKIIAQREYFENNLGDRYRLSGTKVYDSDNVFSEKVDKLNFLSNDKIFDEYQNKLKYENSWYIAFQPKFMNFFSKYYLVVVNKDDGRVHYSHDSNILFDIGQLIFETLKPKLVISALIGKYYRDNNDLPENLEQLEIYIESISKENSLNYNNFREYKLKKLTNSRIKVIYDLKENMKDIYRTLSEGYSGFNGMDEFDLDVSIEGEKILLQIYDDNITELIVTDSNVSIVDSGSMAEKNIQAIKEMLDKLFE